MALLCATVFWGLSFPLGKSLALAHEAVAGNEADVFITVSTIWPRFAIAALVMLPFAWRALSRLTRRELSQGAGLALFLSGGLALQMDGLRYTEASTSAFLSQGYTILLPLAVFGRMRRWPSSGFVVGTVLVVAGLMVLAGVDWRTLRMGRGEFETLLSTGFFTGQILWLDRSVFRGNRPLAVTLVMFTVVASLFLGAALALGSSPAAVVAPFRSPSWLAFTLGLSFACTVGAITLMNAFQPFLNPAEAGVIYATEPVWASIMALFLPAWISLWSGLDYPNESLTAKLLIGGGLVTLANIVIQWHPPAATHGNEKAVAS